MNPQTEGTRRPSHRLHRLHVPLIVTLALAVTGVVVGPSGRVALADPAVQAPGSGGGPVGLWTVAHPTPDNPTARDLTVLTPDGFMFASNAPSMSVAPGQGPPGTTHVFDSQGFGLWQQRGDGRVDFKFLEMAYDPDGTSVGSVSIHGTVALDPSGNTFSGTYVVTVTFPDGTSMDVVGPSPVTGTRVTVDQSS